MAAAYLKTIQNKANFKIKCCTIFKTVIFLTASIYLRENNFIKKHARAHTHTLQTTFICAYVLFRRITLQIFQLKLEFVD